MRKLYYFILSAVVCFVSACEEDTPLPYDGLTGITFQPVNLLSDNVIISDNPTYPTPNDSNFVREYFLTYDKPDTFRIFKVPVAVMGYTTDFDRPVSIEIDPSTTLEPGSYEVASDFCMVAKGKSAGVLNIKVDAQPDYDKVRKLVIRLVPNNYFSYVGGDGKYFTCYLYGKNRKPRYWDSYFSRYLGLYSNNKFDFIRRTMLAYETWDFDYETMEYVMVRPYEKNATLETFRSLYNKMDEIQGILQDEYAIYKEEYGPIYDETTHKEIMFNN